MEHMRNILEGFSSVFAGFVPRDYEQSSGFDGDAECLRSDARALGSDFTKAAQNVYGQTSSSTSKKQ